MGILEGGLLLQNCLGDSAEFFDPLIVLNTVIISHLCPEMHPTLILGTYKTGIFVVFI